MQFIWSLMAVTESEVASDAGALGGASIKLLNGTTVWLPAVSFKGSSVDLKKQLLSSVDSIMNAISEDQTDKLLKQDS